MSIVPVAGDAARFFAVQRFYAGFDAAASVVVEACDGDGAGPWTVSERLRLPYLHRLAAVSPGPEPILLACTLCAAKANVDDWTQPGGVYRIATARGAEDAWRKTPVIEGLRRNHGYCLANMGGGRAALVASMEGLFSIALPGGARRDWSHEQLLSSDVSDAAAVDWNGDGLEELVTIEPFHGDRYVFYSRDSGGAWRAIHEMPCLLGHSLWAGEALRRKVVILGERLGGGRIQVVFPTADDPKDWPVHVVDRDTGGTNVAVVQATPDALEFVSANNDNNQVVLYRVTA
jgi:hypothetical protein